MSQFYGDIQGLPCPLSDLFSKKKEGFLCPVPTVKEFIDAGFRQYLYVFLALCGH